MKILVCSDGTKLSTKAVISGIDLAKSLDANVIGLTVVKGPTPDGGLKAEAKKIQDRLNEIAEYAQKQGVKYELIAKHASTPWEGIVITAKEMNVDFVVMASRGMGSIGCALIGSETQKTLAQIDRPVLVVR